MRGVERNFVTVLLAAALVLITVLALGAAGFWVLRGTEQAAPPPTALPPLVIPTPSDPYVPSTRRTAPASAASMRRTWCPDCQAAGQPANVWADAAMSSVTCRLAWDAPVTVISTSGGMALVSGSGCRGWMRTSLLR